MNLSMYVSFSSLVEHNPLWFSVKNHNSPAMMEHALKWENAAMAFLTAQTKVTSTNVTRF